jgi:threonine dehydratase
LRSPTDADIAAARAAVARVARRTPVLSTRTISERAGGHVVLKAENLQRTGSFKVRGATAKLAAVGEERCRRGVVAASAGNHAQGVAAAAQILNMHATIVMPKDSPLTKRERTQG